jgi:hypothetical protein
MAVFFGVLSCLYMEKSTEKKQRFKTGLYFLGCFLPYIWKNQPKKKQRFKKGLFFLGCFIAYI